jgi:hypothetical protein
MSDYDNPEAEGVQKHLIDLLAATPLDKFHVVEFRHPVFGKTAFSLIRPDGTVWIVTTEPGKLELSR